MEGTTTLLGREYIAQIIKDRFGFDAKEQQVETLETLLDKQSDVILIARTGFGKSIIFQAAPLLFSPAKTALILMPLNALEEEQCEKLQAISGCRPFVLNGDTHTYSNIKMIREGRFTHIFTSPEIAISKSFNQDVLKHPSFSVQLCLLAIDEVHLVAEWREFRPSYYDLGILRSRLPYGTPALGASATLDRSTLGVVRDRCGFSSDHKIIKTALDRPEIYIQITPLQEPATTMLDLQWLLPAEASSPLDIPKTIIFMDSIRSIRNACALMRVWMNRLAYPVEAHRWISPFFSDMASSDKTRIAASFRLPSDICVGPKILIATDAYGLGIDNPDVERVVQWLLPTTMPRLYQRMGRAMRCGLGQGHFTLLYPPWCIGPKSGGVGEGCSDSAEQITGLVGSKRGGGAQKVKDADRRRDLPPGQWELLNAPSNDRCVRLVGLEYLEDDAHRTSGYIKPQPCCSYCDPKFQVSTDCHSKLAKAPSKDSLRRPWILRRLREWRGKKALDLFPDSYLAYCPWLIMPDSVVALLADWGEYIHDETTMRRWVGYEWDAARKYHTEIVAILEEAHALDDTKGVIFDEWTRCNDMKRKRILDPDLNVAQSEYDSRRLSWLISNGFDTTIEKGTSRKRVKKVAPPVKDSATKKGLDKGPSKPPATCIKEADSPRALTRPVNDSVPKSTPPRRPHQALQERSPNIPKILSPSRVGRIRRLPSKYAEHNC